MSDAQTPDSPGNRPQGHDMWTVWDPDRENARHFDTRADAEERQADVAGLDVDAEIYPPGESPEALFHADGGPDTNATPTQAVEPDTEDSDDPDGEPVDAEIIEHAPRQDPADAPDDLPEKALSDDPLKWVPEHFVDEIEGVPTINRKGYAVIAEHYDISVRAEPVTRPSETGFEYAEFQATATTPDGTEYTGWGSAHVDREDDKTLLAEMAETRAMKRATAWATGVGMTAVEELKTEVGNGLN